jgi:hypothetical protein
MTTSTPQEFFESVIYASLPWPWKTTWLERDSARDLTARPASAQVAIAELYHENSKLFPQTMSDLTSTRVDVADVRRLFVRRRAAALAEAAEQPVPSPVRDLFTSIAQSVEPDLFYAIELRLALRGVLVLHEPAGDTLIACKLLTEHDFRILEAALAPSRTEARWEAIVFVLASFARNELLFGSRGYRHTLIEAGRVIQEVLDQGNRRGVAVTVLSDFFDRDVDALLEADGVEEGVLAVLELGGLGDDR